MIHVRHGLPALFFLLAVWNLPAQEAVTEEEFLKRDSALWGSYERRMEEIYKGIDLFPEKGDSLKREAKAFQDEVFVENTRLALRYASVPSGLKRLFMTRLRIPKDTLEAVWTLLPSDLQKSFYGKAIREYIHTRQIGVGDSIYCFPCMLVDGTPFDWEVTKGKQLLILNGGMGCMGEGGRRWLDKLYRRTSRERFLCIVYCPCLSMEEFREQREFYPYDYIFVSDLRGLDGPMKIQYGTQATPTCFLTDEAHVVKVRCEGLNMEKFKEHLHGVDWTFLNE